MQRWLRLSGFIDSVNLQIGRGISWLTFAMVLIGAYNALARYAGRSLGLSLASNAYIELQWYMFSAVFLLGAAATLARDGHVRVDVLFGRMSARARAWIDLVGSVVLLLPFCLMSLLATWPAVRNSWQIGEVSPDPGGLPRYPIKTLILVAFGLLIAQGISHVIRKIAYLRGIDAARDKS
ncbi:MAG: TRAP transporter small permease subunit [bacterium]|nr:TRAP transporter small permease subunit [bacterium]